MCQSVVLEVGVAEPECAAGVRGFGSLERSWLELDGSIATVQC